MTISPGSTALNIVNEKGENIITDTSAATAGNKGFYLNGKVTAAIAPIAGDEVLAYPNGRGGWIIFKASGSTGTILYIDQYDIYTRLKLNGSDLSLISETVTDVNHIDAACCVEPQYTFFMTLVNGADYYLYRCPRLGGTCISHNISDFMNSLACNGSTIFFGTSTLTGLIYLYNVSNCYLRGTFDTGFTSLDAVCCDADNVYYTTYDNFKVYKRDIDDVDNNTGSVLATTAAGVTYDSAALCTDKTYIYLATNVISGAQKITKYNCSDLSLVSSVTLGVGEGISRIATDGTYLYYIDPARSKVCKANCSDLAAVTSVDIDSGDPDYIASYPPWPV